MVLEPLVKRGSIYYPMPARFLIFVVCGRPVCAFSDPTVAHALHACLCTWYALCVSHAYMAPKQRTSYSRSCVVDHSNRVAEHCVTYNNTPGDKWPKLFFSANAERRVDVRISARHSQQNHHSFRTGWQQIGCLILRFSVRYACAAVREYDHAAPLSYECPLHWTSGTMLFISTLNDG